MAAAIALRQGPWSGMNEEPERRRWSSCCKNWQARPRLRGSPRSTTSRSRDLNAADRKVYVAWDALIDVLGLTKRIENPDGERDLKKLLEETARNGQFPGGDQGPWSWLAFELLIGRTGYVLG